MCVRSKLRPTGGGGWTDPEVPLNTDPLNGFIAEYTYSAFTVINRIRSFIMYWCRVARAAIFALMDTVLILQQINRNKSN